MRFLFDEFTVTIVEVISALAVLILLNSFFAISGEVEGSTTIYQVIWGFLISLIGG